MILEGIHHVGEPGRGFQGGIEESRTVRLPDVVQLEIDVVGPQDELQGGVIIKTLQYKLL